MVNVFRGQASKKTLLESIQTHFGMDLQSTVTDFNKVFAASSAAARNHGPLIERSTRSCCVAASAFLPSLDEDMLRSILFGIKRNKSPGIDGIRVADLCRNFHAIKHVLLFMLNRFIALGTIPPELKTATIKPLFKGGSPDRFDCYRPISVLPCIAEILEKHLFTVMTSFANKFEILSCNQYGFVSGKGTQCLLEDFSDLIHTAFDRNLFTCAIFLDLAKAFDTVNHTILLKKLYNYGFRGQFQSLLSSFFSDRSQVVSVGNFRSSRVILKAGVPQGSVLSPLLFNLYVNDMSDRVVGCRIFQYADDTVLAARHLNFSDALRLLSNDASRLMDWFGENLISINTSKTKLVCFRNPLKCIDYGSPFLLHRTNCPDCTCRPLELVDNVKYLGVFFDSDMAWNSHLSYVCGKLRSVSCLLYNCKVFMPFSVRKSVAHALGYSILRYGVTIFGECSNQWHIRVDRILKALLNSVAYSVDHSSALSVFEMLQMPTFRSLFQESVVLRHFWCDDFKNPSLSPVHLRNPSRFIIPRCFTRYGKRVRSHYVPVIFNKLPPHIFEASGKRKLKKLLRSLV